MNDFDFGVDIPTIDNFKLWPTKGEFTALLDGDMLPYIAGYTTDIQDANRAYRAAHSKFPAAKGDVADPSHALYSEFFAALLETPEFWNKANQINWLINDWVAKAGADSAIVYLSGADNYRINLAFTKEYKGQRKSEKPPFFYELRHYIATHHNAVISKGNEADDLMSIEQHSRHRLLVAEGIEMGSDQHKVFSDSAIVTKDKDLKIVPGWNVDPDSGLKSWGTVLGALEPKWKDKEVINYEYWPTVAGEPMHPDLLAASGVRADTFASGARKGEGKTKRVAAGTSVTQYIEKLKGSGLKFFYSQLLTGDTVDNYPGIPGCGATKAFELLEPATSEEELFYIVRDAYKANYSGGTSEAIVVENYRGGKTKVTAVQLMLEQGRLAHMQTFPGELWRSKHSCPTGDDKVWQHDLKTNTSPQYRRPGIRRSLLPCTAGQEACSYRYQVWCGIHLP
jgi:hypothetical protein